MFNLKKNNTPSVSIIIPTHNAEEFIERTISSVRRQTYPNWELIVVDDASTDGTVRIIENFQRIDARISVIRFLKNSGGPAHPKNIGIKKSKGEFIAFLDHDDEWVTNKIERQVNFLLEGGFDFVASNFFVITNNRPLGIYQDSMALQDCFKKNILKRNFIHSCSSVIIKRDVFNVVGGFDENMKWSDDRDLYLRILFTGFSFGYIREALFFWHSRPDSAGKKLSFLKKAKELEYFIEKHVAKYNEFEESLLLFNKRILGNYYCLAGKMSIGRRVYVDVLKRKFNLYIFFLLLLSFFGSRIYRMVSFIKRRFISRNPLEKAS